jgi:hypothetical protein
MKEDKNKEDSNPKASSFQTSTSNSLLIYGGQVGIGDSGEPQLPV